MSVGLTGLPYYLRQQKFELAYKEACARQRSWLFWDPLIQASTYGLLGRSEEGSKFVHKLLELKPDFPEKGEQLIRNYIKFEKIYQRVVEGLQKAGLKL